MGDIKYTSFGGKLSPNELLQNALENNVEAVGIVTWKDGLYRTSWACDEGRTIVTGARLLCYEVEHDVFRDIE